jgi:hypothetical protein
VASVYTVFLVSCTDAAFSTIPVYFSTEDADGEGAEGGRRREGMQLWEMLIVMDVGERSGCERTNTATESFDVNFQRKLRMSAPIRIAMKARVANSGKERKEVCL